MNDKKTAHALKRLKETHLGNDLSSQEIERMLCHCKILSFSPGEMIFQQGKCIEGFYLLMEGKVDIYTRTLGKGVKKIEVLEAGDFLGEVCFIEKDRSPTAAVSKSRVQCLHLSPLYIEWLAAYSPETKYKILRKISVQVCRRLKQVHDRAADFIAHSDMLSLSLFGRIVHSVTYPKAVSLSEEQISCDHLRKKQLFHSFTREEMDDLFACMNFLQAPKNCILIHEGDKNASCFIVVRGAVQSSIMQDNKMAKLSVIGPETLFASIACVDAQSAFTITFLTCESALLLKIPEQKLVLLQKSKPQLWYKLYDLICESIVALGRSMSKLDVRLHIERYNR